MSRHVNVEHDHPCSSWPASRHHQPSIQNGASGMANIALAFSNASLSTLSSRPHWLSCSAVTAPLQRLASSAIPTLTSAAAPATPAKTAPSSFFEFSPCLSRACVGKKIVFSVKVAQKRRSSCRPHQTSWSRSPHPTQQGRHLGSTSLYSTGPSARRRSPPA